MSLVETLFSQGTIERLGWMLVHFLWQAAAVALLLAVLLRLLRRVAANLRYAVACGALALMVVLPLITIQLVEAPGPVAEAGPPPELSPPDATEPLPATMQTVGELPPLSSSPLEAADLAMPAPWQERAVAALEPALPYLVLGWLVGVFGLSAWHLGGWTQLHRLKRRMTSKVDVSLHATLDELATRLGVQQAVALLESAVVDVPTVIGWLRPVILLPASALTGLSPDQLQAILAHELAHIRRHDYLANILQTVIEILGFYHPAVWWVSNRIRVERENCCDDLAVQACGNSLQYARALTSMEEIRHSRTDLALAATGGSLMARVARLLGRPAVDDRRFAWLPGLIALVLVTGIILPAAFLFAAPSPAPNPLPQDAAAPAAAEPSVPWMDEPARTQVVLTFTVIDVFADRVLDMDTAARARNFLTRIRPVDADQPTDSITPPMIEELGAPLRDVFARFEPIPPRSMDLADLLIARGYAEMMSKPKILTSTDEPASITLGQANDPNAPGSSAPGEFVKLTVVPHVLEDLNATRLEIDYEDQRAMGSPDDPNRPMSNTQITSTLVASNDQHAAIIVKSARNEDKRFRLLLIGPTTVYRPRRAAQEAPDASVRTLVASPTPNDLASQDKAQILVDFTIARVLRDATLDRDSMILIGGTLAAEKPQIANQIAADPNLNPTLGETLKRYVIGQPLSQETGQALLDLLQTRGFVTVQSRPKVVATDGDRARVHMGYELPVPSTSRNGNAGTETTMETIECGISIDVTPHIEQDRNITLDLAVEAVDPVPQEQPSDLPTIRTQAITSTMTVPDNRSLWLLVEPGDYRDAQTRDPESTLVVLQPSIAKPASGPAEQSVGQVRQGNRRPRQVMLDARVVVMERGNLLNLGVQWQFPTMQDGRFFNDDGSISGLALGYSPDRAFTDALLANLVRLEADNKAEIVSHPQVVALEGHPAQLRSVEEEWCLMSGSDSEFQKIQAGTILRLTPRIGDANEITLETAIELSTGIPRGADGDLPIVTRRQSKNRVTVLNGGTVAIAGLNGSSYGQSSHSAKELAIFVTANVIPETSRTGPSASRF